MTRYTCEECDTEHHEDDGILYEEEGIFECYACYDVRIGKVFDSMQDADPIARNYPHLARMVAMNSDDPVGFYLACKDAPETLPY